jgi:hypothetical protein
VWLFLPFPEMCLINEVCSSWRNAISPNNERFWSLVHQSYVNPLPRLVFKRFIAASSEGQKIPSQFLGLMI